MTQAAVSYQIKVLEERVGSPLFTRRARGVSLTAEGARLAARSGEALEILREAFAEARRDSAEVLTISALATFATRILAPRLGAFQIAHPGIGTRVDLFHGEEGDRAAPDADVTICFGGRDQPGYCAERLMAFTFAPMISPAFIARHGPVTTPRDLLHKPRIDADHPKWVEWFTAAGVALPEARPRGAGRVRTQILEAEGVIAGQGACLLTPVYFRDLLKRCELIQPFETTVTGLGRTLVMLYPERRRNAPATGCWPRWRSLPRLSRRARRGCPRAPDRARSCRSRG